MEGSVTQPPSVPSVPAQNMNMSGPENAAHAQQPGTPLDCELTTLAALGWQKAYSPDGYSITASLPHNLTFRTWQSLGCLSGLVNLTLAQQVPGLPDAWAGNSSFASLQTLNFSGTSLSGTLPAAWAQAGVFPQLKSLIFSETLLSGTLPPEWGQDTAFQSLTELHLAFVSITGQHRPTLGAVSFRMYGALCQLALCVSFYV